MSAKSYGQKFQMMGFTHLQSLRKLGDTFGAWHLWDMTNLPSPGRYVVWDPYFEDGHERIWTFGDWDNRGTLHWYNEKGWSADRAPYYYRVLPAFPAKDRVREIMRKVNP